MSILAYIETWEGKFKKTSFEAAAFASKLAAEMGVEAHAVVLNAQDDPSVLGQYGISKVFSAGDAGDFNNYVWSNTLVNVAKESGAKGLIISGTFGGKMILPLAAVAFDAGLVTNISDFPSSVSPLIVRRSAFSSKGFVDYEVKTERFVLSIIPNGIGLPEAKEAAAEVQTVAAVKDGVAEVKVLDVDRVKGKIPLPEAEMVVSAGRGLKDASNWNLIEDLAEALGASTACSKPVSDMGWRPHSEHVGQTGIAINPNLYIAIGISGAIQHLAGVSASKKIVVINTDNEAPFFKAADYGIVGDAFEVVPKLTEAIRKFKADN
ncbi:MAG: electron transfer flavoprotein subunit alpha/FixB family protein [Flavobacteriales bacterium]|nr:MAG: electron transfer flavoprotein subunit alpha/FixB family protein [Flavobacteriales bacterium]